MLNNLLKSLIFCVFLLIGNINVFGDIIKVGLIESETEDVLVFYHDRRNVVTPSMSGNQGRVRASKSVTLKRVSKNIDKVCSFIKVTKNIINFEVKSGYIFKATQYGENQVAFRLRKMNSSKNKSTIVKEPKIVELAKNVDLELKPTPDLKVKVVDTKSLKQIIFPFESNVGAAIFSRGNYLWMVFDKRKNFYIDNNSFIESWTQNADAHNTIIKITLKQKLAPQISKKDNNWIVKFVEKSINPKNILKPELSGDNLVTIKKLGKAVNIVDIRDDNIGDILRIVPVYNPNHGITSELNKLDYKILQSYQGIAIALVSDDVKILYNDKSDSLDISSQYMLDTEKENSHTTASTTILPFEESDLHEANFLQTKLFLYNNIILAEDDNAKQLAEIELAKFYFSHSMYHEALALLARAESISIKPVHTLNNLVIRALGLVFTNQSLGAREVFAELKNNYVHDNAIYEIKLWERYNEYLLGNMSSKYIGVSDNKLLAFYPDKIYWDLIFAELDIALFKRDTKLVDQILSNIRKTTDISVMNNIKYYKAKYFYLLNQPNLAEQLLEEVKQNAQNGKEFLMADLQLIKILYEQKSLDWISAVQKLNQLRFVWRGDKYEMQLLMAMALAYSQNDDLINAIRTYKYIVEAFGRQSDNNFFITSQIVELYRRIFLSDEMQELDDFSIVALFYEFKDYTPIGADGDKVVLGIARRMLNLDLLEMASSILEHQVMYRLRGADRMVTANHLALVLLMDKKPVQALKVLNDTDNENFGFAEHQKRTLLKAKALIDMERYEDALSYIGDTNLDSDTIMLKAEILFRSHKVGGLYKFYGAIIER
ncbi:MAG UNVERIFIED_CONTAM: CDC27 family protein [Rickettsiaceae bacterium]|jgi:hypothetical protein